MDEDYFEVEGEQLLRGTQYLNGKELKFGEILSKHILLRSNQRLKQKIAAFGTPYS